MAPTNNQVNGRSTGHNSNMKKEDDWPFQGNILPEIHYGENFAAEINALALEDLNDSGYFSNESLECDKTIVYDQTQYLWSKDSVQGDSFAHDAAASGISNHGSAYEGIKNESVTLKETAYGQTLKSSKKARLFDFDELSLSTYEGFGEEMFGPSPSSLQRWVQTPERHESIAYRLERPAKKRKTGTARQ